MIGLPHLLGVAVLAGGVSSCALLDLLLGVPPPFDPDASFPTFPMPSGGTTFTTGNATVELDGRTLVLDELAGGGSMVDELGVRATWTDGAGFYLTFYGYPDVGFGGESGYLSMDRIFDNQHWVIYDPSRCVTTTEQADATGISGTAICRGLEWSDYFSSLSGLGLPEEIEGEPAFDADITFEAQ